MQLVATRDRAFVRDLGSPIVVGQQDPLERLNTTRDACAGVAGDRETLSSNKLSGSRAEGQMRDRRRLHWTESLRLLLQLTRPSWAAMID